MTDWKKLEPHPIAMAFPEVDSETLTEISQGMKRRGFDPRHPIILFDGKILDGRNRHRICITLGIEPAVEEFKGTTAEAIDFALQENTRRRHLTTSQRGLVAAELKRLTPPPPPTKHKADTCPDKSPEKSKSSKANNKAARQYSVSEKTVQRASELLRIDPEAAQKVKAGKVSLNAALKAAKAAVPSTPKPCPPPPAEPEPVLDTEGREMHPDAVEALTTGRDSIIAHLHAIRRAKNGLKEICATPLGRKLNWQRIEAELESVVTHLKEMMPHTSCPMGDPCDDDCGNCRGTQWVCAATWRGIHRDYKGAKK